MRLKHLAVATIAALLLIPAVSASALSNKRIEAVSFTSPTMGYLTGGYSLSGGTHAGLLSFSQDGGLTWKASALPNAWFQGIHATSTGAWAVSDFSNRAYSTVDVSGIWGSSNTVLPASSSVMWNDVDELSGGRVVVVGRADDIPKGGYPGRIASSVDDGDSWTTQYEGPLYPGATEDDPYGSTSAIIESVDTTASGALAWAVGSEYTSTGGDGSTTTIDRWLILKTTDGGATNWTAQTAPADIGFPLTCVAAASPTTAFAAGGNRAFVRTTNGGTTWSQIAFQRATGVPTMYANAIAAVDDKTVVAVGDAGVIAKSTTAGNASSWAYTVLPGGAPLRGIDILTPTTWIVVGDDETIYRTTNAGASWTAVCAGLTAPTVSLASPDAGFALDSGVTIAGVAADVGVGLSSVDVKVVRPDGYYWTGSAWTSSETWLPVESINNLANWSLGLSSDVEADSGGVVTVTVRATDGLGLTKTVSVVSGDSRQSTTLSSSSRSAYLAFRGTGTLSGYLNADGGGLQNQKVVLESSSNGVTFKDTGVTSLTSSSGYFSFSVKPNIKTYYRASFPGALGFKAATPTTAINFVPRVYLSSRPWASRSTIYHGRYYYWYSSLNPRHTAGSRAVKMYYQRYYKGKWRAYKTVYAYAYNYSYYSRVHAKYKIPYKGRWRVRAFHDDAGHAATYSGWQYMTVR